jgi:hypothetical protein
MRRWLLGAAWITLPVTAGPGIAEGLRSWGGAPQVVGSVLCWIGWALGLLACLAPRPLGLTAARALAPAGVVVALVATARGDISTVAAIGAIAATLVAAVLVADPAFAELTANAVSYGDEQRYPLRVPPGLFVGPLPLARAVLVGGLVAGPLFLADGHLMWGIVALALGLPAAAVAAQVLHRLSRRWVVVVPAGVVIVDPMTLADNTLFPREHVQVLRALRGDEEPGLALDLRLGATLGSVLFVFDEPAELTKMLRALRRAETVKAPSLLVAVAHRQAMFASAARRRVRIEVSDPGATPQRV